MPKISIITTTYNHQDFIASTIESIIKQSYEDWELLIGDDSPNQETWNIIQTYIHQYPSKVKAWYHTPNKGIIGNMDFLISQVSPESQYISFLEGDDMYSIENISEKMKIFHSDSEIDILYSNYDFIDQNGEKINGGGYDNIIPIPSKKIFSQTEVEQFKKIIFSWSTSACKKSVYLEWKDKRFETYEKNFSVSDYDFYFQSLLQRKIFYYIDISLVQYRWHSGNLSTISGRIPIDLKKLYDFYIERKLISLKYYTVFLCRNFGDMTFIFLLNGNKKKAIWYYVGGIKIFQKGMFFTYLKLGLLFLIPHTLLCKLYSKKQKNA